MKTGNHIRQLRKKKGMTILELASVINSDVGNISRLERDVQGYSHTTLVKIAEALGIQVSDLFIEDDNTTLINNNEKKPLNTEQIADAKRLKAIYDAKKRNQVYLKH